ncbi:hypothetical protein LSTR_LSTR007479 [Laodelphax striatellus]|uniref:Uncharacterized protein n=1 Tax=Laodelphax striatellus TaxID=195883 RepID=A0A482X4R5_LAOST|nr:hypothetical protein LSTR_LSTR007479 [Laodelphax striatellus]
MSEECLAGRKAVQSLLTSQSAFPVQRVDEPQAVCVCGGRDGGGGLSPLSPPKPLTNWPHSAQSAHLRTYIVFSPAILSPRSKKLTSFKTCNTVTSIVTQHSIVLRNKVVAIAAIPHFTTPGLTETMFCLQRDYLWRKTRENDRLSRDGTFRMLGRISCDNGLGGQEGAHAGRGEESKEKGKGTVPFAKWLLGYSGIRNESMPPLDLRIWKRALLVTGQSEEANDKGGKHPPPPPNSWLYKRRAGKIPWGQFVSSQFTGEHVYHVWH